MTNSRIKWLAQAVRRNPEDSFSKFALALELLKNNRTSQALPLFESIHRNDPDYLGIYYHLGKLYQRLQRLDDAERCYLEGVGRAISQKESRTRSELEEALQQLNEERTDET